MGGDALSASDVESLVRQRKVATNDADELIGGWLVDVARARLYAAASLRPSAGPVAVSAPQVSALAGAILAAEVQKPANKRLDRRIDIDLSGFPTGFLSRQLEDLTGRCLGHSAFRQQVYTDTWGASESEVTK